VPIVVTVILDTFAFADDTPEDVFDRIAVASAPSPSPSMNILVEIDTLFAEPPLPIVAVDSVSVPVIVSSTAEMCVPGC
jgi:hypothetical protein